MTSAVEPTKMWESLLIGMNVQDILKTTLGSKNCQFRTNGRSRLTDIETVKCNLIHENGWWTKRKVIDQFFYFKNQCGHNVWPTTMARCEITYTRKILLQRKNYGQCQQTQKRDWSENFESKRGRSGIIGRILQPKGYSYCHTIYHTDTVTESSSERLTLHPLRHCRSWATEYITVRLLYIYHHILSTDNKEILLPPTVSIIYGLAL